MPHEEKADFAFAFRDVIKTGAVGAGLFLRVMRSDRGLVTGAGT